LQDTELITSAQNGDTLAYGELMELLHRKVEKFAFQCGVNVEDIHGVTQEVFFELHKSLGEFESTYFTTQLYKIALHATRNYGRREKQVKELEHELHDETSRSTRSPQSRILVFDEDRQLHEVIQSLEGQHRNPLVLFDFHELSFERIGEILNISTDKVESRLLSSKEQLKTLLEVLDDDQLETNLNLLKKSYKRVPSKFNADDVLQKIIIKGGGVASPSPTKPTYSRQKLSVWAVGIGFVFLIGILSASFVAQRNDNGSQIDVVAEENDSEKFKKSYEKEKTIRREILGLTEDEFNQIEMVQMADQLFSSYFHPDQIDEHVGHTLYERYNQVIESLKLPSEMIDEATVSRQQMNEQESMLFIDTLDLKINHLLKYYNALIDNHRELLNTAKMNGKLDANYLSTYRDELPQELKSMMEHAPKQGIAIQVSQDETSYVAKFHMPEQWGMMYEHLGEPAMSFFHLKQMAPFTFGGELVYPPQESAMMLAQLEHILLVNTNYHNSLYTDMKTHYEDLAYTLIFGTPNTKIITDGRVNEEFRIVWNNLRYSYGASPIKYFIWPMYESVSRNDWEVDETYNSLNFNDLQVAFSLAESGDLEAIMPKEDSGAITETISWPNNEVLQKVEGYTSGDNEYQDIHQIIGMTPIESVVLFDYAQEMKLQHVNHQLLSFTNFVNHQDYETVLNDWLNDNLISDEATSLRYEDEKTSEHFGSFIGTVDVMNGNSVIRSIPIIRSYRDLWQIDVAFGSTLYREPLTKLNESTIQTVQDLYNRYKENHDYAILKDMEATIVAGIYLEALTLGDLETQYELLNKRENTNVPPRDEFLANPTGEEFDWKMRFDSFEAIQIDNQNENEEYNVTVWLTIKEEFRTDGEYSETFQMRKTVDGWRVQFMPFAVSHR